MGNMMRRAGGLARRSAFWVGRELLPGSGYCGPVAKDDIARILAPHIGFGKSEVGRRVREIKLSVTPLRDENVLCSRGGSVQFEHIVPSPSIPSMVDGLHQGEQFSPGVLACPDGCVHLVGDGLHIGKRANLECSTVEGPHADRQKKNYADDHEQKTAEDEASRLLHNPSLGWLRRADVEKVLEEALSFGRGIRFEHNRPKVDVDALHALKELPWRTQRTT